MAISVERYAIVLHRLSMPCKFLALALNSKPAFAAWDDRFGIGAKWPVEFHRSVDRRYGHDAASWKAISVEWVAPNSRRQ